MKKLRRDIEMNPLTIFGEKIKEVGTVKILGDCVSSTPKESIHNTVLKRLGIVKRTIIEIRMIIEDTRASKIGGINLAFTLWNSTVVPSLLYNAETWIEIPKKTFELLQNLFNYFYSCIFRIGQGTPKVNYYWQVGGITVENMILQKKLLFWFHVKNLPRGSLIQEVLEIQEAKGFTCLTSELAEDLKNIKIKDPRLVSKWQYKKRIKEYIVEKNRQYLLEESKKYKKVSYKQ